MSNLFKRFISALVLIPLFLWVLLEGGTAFNLTLLAVSIIMAIEWVKLAGTHTSRQLLFMVFGFGYIAFLFANFVYLREFSLTLTIFLVLMIWTTDIMAYIFGKNFGSVKLAPKISPNKTLEGAIGGTISAGVVALLFTLSFNESYGAGIHPILMVFIGLGVSILSQLGDLSISWLKRKRGLKDTGRIIPGHGGLLDRVDGFIYAVPLYPVLLRLLSV